MAQQLALFADVAPGEPLPGPPLALAPEPVALPDTPLEGQVGLFDERLGRIRAVRSAIADADLARALAMLGELSSGPDVDAAAVRERVLAAKVAIERAEAADPAARADDLARVGRLLAREEEPWAKLGRHLLARAARHVHGDALTAARLLLEARELDEASAVLRDAVSSSPDHAPTLFALGDVEWKLGRRVAARRAFCDALLADPFDPAHAELADDDVRALRDIAELEVEVEGDPRAWAAPVGIVSGVLTRPLAPREAPALARPAAGDLDALDRARDFVRALSLAASAGPGGGDRVLEARRRMKRASPALFAWYMARKGR